MILHSLTSRHESRSDEFYFVAIGDIHIGSKGCDVERLRKTVEWVRSCKNCLWIGMGDYSESIKVSDRRFDPRSLDPRYRSHLDDLTGMCVNDLNYILSPIKDKCVGLLTGNHEEKLRLRDWEDVHGRFCTLMGAKDLGHDALLRWIFSRRKDGKCSSKKVLHVFASHSTISGRNEGSKINRMMNVAGNIEADLYLFGHGHSLLRTQTVTLYDPARGRMKLKEHRKAFAQTGTFRKTYVEGTHDYSEKGHFRPADLGACAVRVRPWSDGSDLFE